MQHKIMSPSSQTHKHNHLAYQSNPKVNESLSFTQQEKSTIWAKKHKDFL